MRSPAPPRSTDHCSRTRSFWLPVGPPLAHVPGRSPLPHRCRNPFRVPARTCGGVWRRCEGCDDHRVYNNWPREHVAGWEAVVAELRDQGWDVVLLTYEAPVQLE